MANTFIQVVHTYGPLRLALLILVIVDMLLRPVPGSSLELEGIAIASNLIAPVLSPILFMLLLLDFLMSLVYQAAMPVEKRIYFRFVPWTNLLLAVAFFAWWLPFFKALNF